jgi:hypothetical protein
MIEQQKSYCAAHGFHSYIVAGGMFDLRRDGTEAVTRVHLGRFANTEAGWKAAAELVAGVVAREGSAVATEATGTTPATGKTSRGRGKIATSGAEEAQEPPSEATDPAVPAETDPDDTLPV